MHLAVKKDPVRFQYDFGTFRSEKSILFCQKADFRCFFSMFLRRNFWKMHPFWRKSEFRMPFLWIILGVCPAFSNFVAKSGIFFSKNHILGCIRRDFGAVLAHFTARNASFFAKNRILGCFFPIFRRRIFEKMHLFRWNLHFGMRFSDVLAAIF